MSNTVFYSWQSDLPAKTNKDFIEAALDEALKRLKRRDKAIICCRVMHNQRGVEADKENIYKWVDGRLKLYQVEHFDLVIVSNSAHDTPRSGYWDME